jgi:hypothetical protein
MLIWATCGSADGLQPSLPSSATHDATANSGVLDLTAER